jgi:hypothetical protein
MLHFKIEPLQFRAGIMCGVLRNDLLGMTLNCCLDDMHVLRIRQIRANLNRLIRRNDAAIKNFRGSGQAAGPQQLH